MRQTKYNVGDRLEITWFDIIDTCSWRPLAEIEKLECAKVLTLGYFVANTRLHDRAELIITHSLADDAGDGMCIPWGCIKDIRVWPDNSKVEYGEK